MGGEDGVSLVELMVAIALLGVVLAALAGTLVVTLGAVTQSEREVTATQLASELAEELQIGAFDDAALYAGEAAAAGTDWQARLDPGGTFEGRDLVVVSGPPPSGRDARYPEPVVTDTRAATTYRADRYITWLDRDGDGNVETKRQTVFVSWSAPDGDTRELRFDSERVPTQGEAQATNSGTRVISFTFSPDPVELREDTGNEGRLTQQVDVTVRTNEGTTSATLQLYTYDPDADSFVLREPVVTAGEAAEPSGTGWVTWTATVPVSADYTFGNGPIDVLFQATDGDGATVEALGTFTTFGGPYDVDTPTPDGTSSGEDEEPTEDPDPGPDPDTGDGDPVAITVQQRPLRLCVDPSSSNLSTDVYVRVEAEGLTQEDGKVTMTYPYYQNRNNKNPNKTANDVMDFVEPATDPPSYETTIEAGSKVFKVGDTVTFALTATRADGAVDEDRDTGSFTVGVESC